MTAFPYIRAGVVALALSLAPAVPAQPPVPVDIAQFLRRDTYEDIEISPTGDYFAATVPLEDRTVLVVIRRSDKAVTAKVHIGEDTVIDRFWWVSADRVLASVADKYGRNDEPSLTGELIAVDVDGKRGKWLTTRGDYTFAVVHDPLRDDDRNIQITALSYGDNYETALEKMDVYDGRRSPVSSAPVRRARFVTDAAGAARFALGAGNDNAVKLYYRDGKGGDWRLLNDESVSGVIEVPLGFSADGRTAYLQVERKSGPDEIVAWDPATDRRTSLLSDPVVDPLSIVYAIDSDAPVGARYAHDRVRTRFFDPESRTARAQRQLEKAFPDQAVTITSATRDGDLLLAQVWSDRNPGDFYLFDTIAKRAEPVFSRRLWIDPAKAPATRPVEFAARDGLKLHGHLTLPPGAATDAPLPMVLLPHGGPFGIFDGWWFDEEVQILAHAGYAVLRVNYRGSGNYGRAFREAGARQWGRAMQDDLTDATRWAIAQRIADPGRICLYGASYGGYAALMGVAQEPTLYRCAAGYVGVYDLEKMHRDDSRASRSMGNWAREWLGEREDMAALSPTGLADRIKVPVFLAAGGKDRRAPIEHSERMEKALKAAGVPVETLYYPNEGHGFYTEPHRIEYYTRLLAFLSRHLGGATAKSAEAPAQ
ncbi:MAG: alpha/beta hydrolase family protein [Pseudomonadota bacterium]